MARVQPPLPIDPQHETLIGRCTGATGPAFPGAKIITPIPDYLKHVMETCQEPNDGNNADYIAELKNADSERIGICLSTFDGFVYAAGDADVEFSIQSISKAFVYALALEEHGIEEVLKHVGVEPSGEAFNELSLEDDTRIPLNPMINAGAITTHTLVGPPELSCEERVERIREGLSAFAGRQLAIDEAVFESEWETAYRNLAITNMLRHYRDVIQKPEDIVRGYTKQCAINVTARDLALMAATFANGGIQPVTGVRVVRRDVVRQTLSVMMTCGMYDGAGRWASAIGFPAKSGVAGGILGVLPGQVGIATFSPRLDKNGNSVRGVRMCKKLSDDMGLHIMSPPENARSVIRRDYILRAPEGHCTCRADGYRPTVGVMSLQGDINFTAAERVLRIISARSAKHGLSVDGYVLDLRSVYSVDRVARRMFREVSKRVRSVGKSVYVIDPENQLDMHEESDTNVGPELRVDGLIPDLSQFRGWEKLPLPDTMRSMAMPQGVSVAERQAEL